MLPVIIIAIGLIVAMVGYLLTSMQYKPAVTEQDFNYSVTYKIDGETKTFNGVYTSRFTGFGGAGVDPLTRYYDGGYVVDGEVMESRSVVIAEKDGYILEVITLFDDNYLMGDDQEGYEPVDPCLEATDAEGIQYGEEDMPEVFDAEIVSWEYPEPIANTFAFAGFAALYSANMGVMLLAALLTLLLCVILVKKDEDVAYSAWDKIGVILNFLAVFVVLPVLSLAACLIQAFPTGPEWIYQAYLCVPPIIAFSVVASVVLRRKGFSKSGFAVQFIGIAVEIILAVLEYVL
jgi:hypothetical protein